jgi:lactate permease
MSFFLSWTPILLILVLAVIFKVKALFLGLWGSLFSIVLAVLVFKTDPMVVGISILDGILTSSSLVLVVFIGIIFSTLLLETGSLQRLTGWLIPAKSGIAGRTGIVSLGIGNFMEGAGVIAEPVVAPMARAMGFAPETSALMSIAGYAGLMHLSLAGVIVTVLAAVTGLPAGPLAVTLGKLSISATVLLALSLPLISPDIRRGMSKTGGSGIRGVAFLLLAGVTASGAAALTAAFVGYSVAGLLGGVAVVILFYAVTRTVPASFSAVWKDSAPFIFLFCCLTVVNLVPPLKTLFHTRMIVTLEIIPGHLIKIRPFYDAYIYLFISLLVALKLQGVRVESLGRIFRKSLGTGAKAVLAMFLFSAMGQVIAYSGFGRGFIVFDPTSNIPAILSRGIVAFAGPLYPVFAPFLGWVGTFLTGYGVASVLLFGKLQMETAALIGFSQTVLTSSLTVGASIGSISSPFKIAIAAPLCGAQGKEGEILRKTIPLGIAISLLVGLFSFLIR